MFKVKSPLPPTPQKLLHLLRCALWEERPDKELFAHGADWQGIMQLARRHTVEAMVAQQMKWVADRRNDKKTMAACIRVMMNTMQANQHMNGVLATLTHALNDEGIRTVLLKGQGVARYYPQPDLRVPGDIDIYVGADQTDTAVARLLERLPGISTHHGRNDKKHVNMTLDGVEIEMHRKATAVNIMAKAQEIQDWTEQQLNGDDTRQTVIDGCEVTVPSALFDCLYIFHHLYRHLLANGVGLRHVCDWLRCLYVNRQAIDEAELRRLLTQFGMLHAWQLFGLMAVRHLGMPQEAMPLYSERRAKNADRLMQVLINESNFGFERMHKLKEQRPKGHLAGLFFAMRLQTNSHWSHVWLFPRQALPLMTAYYLKGVKKIFRK